MTSPFPVPPAPRRRVVVVLGMHNSGTSLLARLISLMGVELGRNVLTRDSFAAAPRYDYWEHAGITEVQDHILTAIDRYWDQEKADWPCPATLWRRPEVLALKSKLAALLEAELAENPGLWGFKDPRTVRLMPLWQDIFSALHIEPLYLISVRGPAPVATSYSKKAQVPYALAERLWTRHYFEALDFTRGARRIVVDYDAWFADWQREYERLADFLDLRDPARRQSARAEVGATIDPQLKQYGRDVPGDLRPITRDLFDLLLAISAGTATEADEAALLARGAELTRSPAEFPALSR